MSRPKKDPYRITDHLAFGNELRMIEETLAKRLDDLGEHYATEPTSAGDGSKTARRVRRAIEAVREIRYAGENLMIADVADPSLQPRIVHVYRAPEGRN